MSTARADALIAACERAGVKLGVFYQDRFAPAFVRLKGAIDEALRCREEGVSKAILFNLCGHGHFDMQAYQDYFAGKLVDQDYDENELAMALAGLPSVPGQA